MSQSNTAAFDRNEAFAQSLAIFGEFVSGQESLPLAEEHAIESWDPASLRPSPENEKLYLRIRRDNPAIQSLAESIQERGLLNPIVTTADRWIVSGHRRREASIVAGRSPVPVIRLPKLRAEYGEEEFLSLLREHNRNREKTIAEKLREGLVDVDPDEAYEALLSERTQLDSADLCSIDLTRKICRSAISSKKDQMVSAVAEVLREHRRFLPINLRKIHYELAQNKRPLRNTDNQGSVFQNDRNSYETLSKDVGRMRTEGRIPHDWIEDETRPSIEWDVHADVAEFLKEQLEEFAKGYRRDLMQSQSVHVELLVEKNTVFSMAKEVAGNYSVPVTSLRGQTSLPVRHKISERFKKSGKRRLVLLVATDFDPSGEAIAESVATSLQQEFGCRDLTAFKVAVTPSQAADLGLSHNFEGLATKKGDSNLKRFVEKHGTDAKCYELEAIPAAQFQRLIAEAIDSVVDVDLLNREREQEKLDAAEIQKHRNKVLAALRELDLDAPD